MIQKISAIILGAAIGCCVLAGCSTATVDGSGSASGDDAKVYFGEADVTSAVNQVTVVPLSQGTALVQASVDTSTKTVCLDVTVTGDDVATATKAAEDALRAISADTAQNALMTAEGRQDQDDIDYITGFIDADSTYANGLGRLYETYAVSVLVDNASETLDVEGQRPAGTDATINWQ
jgi:hypothetical protein